MARFGKTREAKGPNAERRFTARATMLLTSAAIVALALLRLVLWRHPRHASSGELVLPAARYEAADVGGRFVAAAFALLVAFLAVVTLCTLWLFPYPTTDRNLQPPLLVYPEPRLQPSPRHDMQRFLAAEMAELGSYGWVDNAHGVVRLPIDVAMSELAQRGIPDWPTPSSQPKTPSDPGGNR